MLKELLLGTEGEPILKEYADPEVAEGCVKAVTQFGAPKHGTETHCCDEDPFAKVYYDEEMHIFKKREVPVSNRENMGLGNMWVGEIAEIGKGVEGFAIGQRVAGYGNLKPTHIVKAQELLSMPDAMTWQEAVCFDPLQFALGGIRDSHVRMGDAVLVSGLGAIGLMAAQAAKLAGASLVAVSDPIAKRRKTALENGADIAFNPLEEDFGLLLRQHTQGRGVDVVIETSGKYKAIEQGLRALAYGGNFAMVGWMQECNTPIHLGFEAHFNQQKIIFSRACSDPNNDYPRWSFDRICKESWEMLKKGYFRCDNIIAPIVDFSESASAYKEYIIDNPTESIKLGVSFL